MEKLSRDEYSGRNFKKADGGAPKPSEQPAVLSSQAANWSQAERRLIMDALYKAKGNRGRAAAFIGWSRSTLWRKIRHCGIDAHEA